MEKVARSPRTSLENHGVSGYTLGHRLNQIAEEYRSKINEMTKITDALSLESYKCQRATQDSGKTKRIIILDDMVEPIPTDTVGDERSLRASGLCDESVTNLPAGNESVLASVSARSKRLSKLYIAQFFVREEWSLDSEAGLQIDLAARSRSANASRTLASRTLQVSVHSAGSWGEHLEGVPSTPSGLDWLHSHDLAEESSLWRRIVSSPACPRRISWELLGILLIMYDMMEIPLTLSFSVPSNQFTHCMDWFSRLFWTLNIFMVLTTGYISNGVLFMSANRILVHYCKTWMIVDVVTVVPDWIFVVVSSLTEERKDNNASSLVRLLRFLRVFRIARLMRMTKLRDFWYMIYDTIDSEKVGLILEVLKNVLILMVVNHYIACAWCAVGKSQHGKSWLKVHGYTSEKVDWFTQFLAAYHWSITQFESSVDLYAQSDAERAFAIAAVLFAIVGSAYLIGTIASSLARLQTLNERRANNFWILRKYLKQNKVPRELSVRIRCYVESQWLRNETRLGHSSIESLNLLSVTLRSDLAVAIYAPLLSVHPLFNELHEHLHGTARRLMFGGISHLDLAPDDVMFSAGEDATHMSVLTTGTMQYERMHLETAYTESVESHEDWIAEQVLWVRGWCHLGDLRSTTSAELLQVEPEKFISIVKLNPLTLLLMTCYSKEYVQWLNGISKEFLSDISQGEYVRNDVVRMLNTIAEDIPFRHVKKKKATRASVSKRSSRLSTSSQTSEDCRPSRPQRAFLQSVFATKAGSSGA